MKGLRDMLLSFFKERKVLAGTLVGLFIPAIYCFLYLNAIWDPYGKVDQVPGIIINMDKEAEISGQKLNLGLEITDQLLKDHKLDWKSSSDKAQALAEMNEGKNLVIIEIPENFSSSIAALTKDSSQSPEPIRYYANQGQSFIVSQIGDRMTELLREQLNGNVTSKILGKLISAVSDGQAGFMKAADSAKEMQTGAGKLATGTETLTTSLEQATQGAEKLSKGAAQAADGTSKLAGGLGQIKAGNEQAAAQMDQGAQAIGQVGQKLQQLAVSQGLPEETSKALAALAAQTSQLSAAFEQGSKSVSTMVNGEEQAIQQSKQLVQGVQQLQNGLSSLSDGLSKGVNGSKTINSNLVQLESGMKQMADQLNQAGSVENTLKGKENLLATPVAIEKLPVNPVPNNGTFFTGFFAPLSLWVGAIVFSYLTVMVKWQGWGRRSLLPRYFLLALLGIVQAAILDLLLIEVLGLHVDHLSQFIWMTILTSLMFISIVHFIFAMTGVAGNLIVLILLVFQLGLSGGSYPIVMLSEINQHLSPWMPLTYAVQGFRIAISGGSAHVLSEQIVHMVYFLAFGLGLHVIYGATSIMKRKFRKKKFRKIEAGELTA
jgi:putative membrane protein